MKERYQEWAKLKVPNQSAPARPPLRMLDLPDVETLERKLLLYSSIHGADTSELKEMVDEFSRKIFGITRQETEFDWSEAWARVGDSDDWERIQAECEEYESRFKTSDRTDDEIVDQLLPLGVDFRDVNGQPLRCTRSLGRQAEAAAKGIKGKIPDSISVNQRKWENALEEGARVYLAKKRSGKPFTPQPR